MFLIVGLGNPGSEYVNTRHNVGFMAVDRLAQHFGFSPFRAKFDGLISDGSISGEKCLILKPQTFMNLSGNSVVKAAHFYKILPENIVVIHDDIDLQIGQVKAKIGGGTGGHNGLKSLDASITPNYNRIRIGVGNAKGDTVSHVLSRFSKEDEEVICKNIDVIVENIEALLKDGMDAFSNKLGMVLKGNNNG